MKKAFLKSFLSGVHAGVIFGRTIKQIKTSVSQMPLDSDAILVGSLSTCHLSSLMTVPWSTMELVATVHEPKAACNPFFKSWKRRSRRVVV